MKVSIIKNLFILLFFGFFVKVLGLYNKIVLTQSLTLKGLTLYTKMVPIATFFMTIANFSLGPVITQMVSINIAKKPYSNKKIIKDGLQLAIIISSIVSIIHLLLNYFICHFLLRMDILIKPFIFFIPLYYLSSITGIFKGYFHGHNKMETYATGQLFEQIIRIILVFILIKPMMNKNVINGVVAAILTLSIGELFQDIYLFIRIILYTKIGNKPNKKSNYKTLLNKGLKLTSNKLISSISSFLEPVIFTYAFLKTGLNIKIADELYAIIYGYAIPIILTTNFITAAIESSILPSLIYTKENNDDKKFSQTINKALLLSFIPASIVSFLYFFYPYEIMYLFYKTTLGASYIKLLSIPSFIAYFEGVFVSSLLACKKEKMLVFNTIITNIIHLSLIYIFVSIPKINASGIVISFAVSLTISTLFLGYLTITKTPYKIKMKLVLPFILFYILIILLGMIFVQKGIPPIYLLIFLGVVFLLVISFLLLRKKTFHHLKDNVIH